MTHAIKRSDKEIVDFMRHAISEYLVDLQGAYRDSQEFFTRHVEATIDTMCVPVPPDMSKDGEEAASLLNQAVDGYLIEPAVLKSSVSNRWVFRLVRSKQFQFVWIDRAGVEWMHCGDELLFVHSAGVSKTGRYRWPVREGVFPAPSKSHFG